MCLYSFSAILMVMKEISQTTVYGGKNGSVIKRPTSRHTSTTSEHEWPRAPRVEHERPQVEHEWPRVEHEWPRVTTSGTRVTTSRKWVYLMYLDIYFIS